jgi:hypothetical protein
MTTTVIAAMAHRSPREARVSDTVMLMISAPMEHPSSLREFKTALPYNLVYRAPTKLLHFLPVMMSHDCKGSQAVLSRAG